MVSIDEEQPETIETPSGPTQPTDPLVQLATRIPQSLRYRLKMYALKENVGIADIVVKALDQWLPTTTP